MVSRRRPSGRLAKDDKFDFVRDELCRITKANLYRELKVVSSSKNPGIVHINGKECINLCSNDYLGLSRNKAVLRATSNSLNQISQCSSRLISGNADELVQLEEKLADHRGAARALIYPSGYMANIGVISALANKFTTIYSDQFNHASIVDGCKLSGARIAIYRHNDLNHLDELIRMTTSGQKIIITETIFSMDGDRSDLRRIHDIARHHNVITIVDDSHGDFIYETGRSRFESYGLDQVDVHVSSLSKALGCFGGYVAASQEVIELLVNKSRPFIYSSGLPAHLCSAALAAIPIAKKGYLQERLSRNVAFFSSKVDKIGLGNDNSKSKIRSQIIPLIIGDEKKTMQFSKLLLSDGIFIKPIRYPTVQLGKARLRASITATLHKNQLKVALEKIESTGRKLNII